MTVDMTEEEWIRLLNCAGLAPYREAKPVIDKVIAQIQIAKMAQAKAQDQPAAE